MKTLDDVTGGIVDDSIRVHHRDLGSSTVKEDLHRIVNNLYSSASPRLRVDQKKE